MLCDEKSTSLGRGSCRTNSILSGKVAGCGVLNTDNMSVLGVTVDYGPFGFLDPFDPNYTPNLPGRRYGSKFMDECQAIMTRKLGLSKYNKQLISDLLKNMGVDKVDYTNFSRLLSNIKADPTIQADELLVPLKAVLLDIGKECKDAWTSWVKSYIQELSERKKSMDSVNPKYILRNYLRQSSIDAAEQGYFEELKVMARPYDEQPGMEKYARLPPAPGVCMLSCCS